MACQEGDEVVFPGEEDEKGELGDGEPGGADAEGGGVGCVGDVVVGELQGEEGGEVEGEEEESAERWEFEEGEEGEGEGCELGVGAFAENGRYCC